MSLERTDSYLKDSLAMLRHYRKLGKNAIAQCPDPGLTAELDAQSNSIAIIVKHLHGNMLSRWTDFLTTDGEKPTRDRDEEFERAPQTRSEILALWDAGWACLLGALESLTDADITKTVKIRGEEHSVMQAINRQVAHYSYHIGQIAYLARHVAEEHWESLTISKNKSQDFNADVAAGKKSQRQESEWTATNSQKHRDGERYAERGCVVAPGTKEEGEEQDPGPCFSSA